MGNRVKFNYKNRQPTPKENQREKCRDRLREALSSESNSHATELKNRMDKLTVTKERSGGSRVEIVL